MSDTQRAATDDSQSEQRTSRKAVFEALENERARRILQATRTEPRTAPELADALDIPTSTVYRKLDALVDAGLVTESNRICEHGNHCLQYECAIEGVLVDFDTDSVDVQLLDSISDTSDGSGPSDQSITLE